MPDTSVISVNVVNKCIILRISQIEYFFSDWLELNVRPAIEIDCIVPIRVRMRAII